MNCLCVLQLAAAVTSAPISHIHYDVAADSADVATRSLGIATTFDVDGPGQVILALPGWTPGAYEMSWFARWVNDLTVTTADGKPLIWDKVDYQTWRIEPAGAKSIKVSFRYAADTLDNAMSWTGHDFVLFNGTNVFLYPVGREVTSPIVSVHTHAGWRVATGMPQAATPGSYTAANYHDLVDMPFFIGRFDIDSVRTVDRWVRLASYPVGVLTPERRRLALSEIAKVIPPEAAVFHETPWPNYTVMEIADSTFGGASGLEHQNSHVDIITSQGLDSDFIPSLYAHEIFHSWNVKRLRPAEMVPYKYDAPEPTPWLWVSEGITDYYADLAEVRGGVVGDTGFYALTESKIDQVAAAPPSALTDASLSTWIHPVDGSEYVYYPKGSLAGFMLDVIIRDASDNRRSLDDVMRELYENTYKKGRGFTAADWWGAVSRAANGKSFDEFNRRYIDGRQPFPWDTILPLAGLRLQADSVRELRLGVFSAPDSSGHVRVVSVEAGSSAAEAGIRSGDVLVSIGDVPVTDVNFGARIRARYSSATPGTMISVTITRDGSTMNLSAPARFRTRVSAHITADPAASAKAKRVRSGIVHGTVGAS
ncbi:MAG TPA: PDZ domain-containing protein [Gemmatimonadaceae bacterium]|nr:PDZ domain-containing protein [Gemmatimonadaceae bacterium]